MCAFFVAKFVIDCNYTQRVFVCIYFSTHLSMDGPFSAVFSLMTWNLFKKSGVSVVDWPGDREEGMKRVVASLVPDILFTQETSPE